MCLENISNFATVEAQTASQSVQQSYPSLLQDTLSVLTAADHKSGFKPESLLFTRMVQLVAADAMRAPLLNPAVVSDRIPGLSVILQPIIDVCVFSRVQGK